MLISPRPFIVPASAAANPRYNQANGQTTYQMGQMYGGYNAGALVPGQMPPVQPQLYPQQVPQVKQDKATCDAAYV